MLLRWVVCKVTYFQGCDQGCVNILFCRTKRSGTSSTGSSTCADGEKKFSLKQGHLAPPGQGDKQGHLPPPGAGDSKET